MDAKRTIEIILEETRKAPPRYPAYRNDLTACVADIITIERQHKFVAKNVKKEIADQINALGQVLAKHQQEAKE